MKMPHDVFRSLTWIGVTSAFLASPLAAAQTKDAGDYPARPVRLVVPSSAGGQIDTLARVISQKASESWGRPVIVENRPGAGGALGIGTVAKATPDGHTLLATAPNFIISAALQPKLPYDPINDFAGVTQLGFSTQALVVTPALGPKSLKEFIAFVNAQPGRILYSSAGAGTSNHLTSERFRLAAGLKVTGVAFRGAPEALIETLGGRTHFSILPLSVLLPFVKDGRLLALAVNSVQRSALLPDVPALAETLPEFKKNEASFGLLAPAKTPRTVLAKINQEVVRILDLPDVRKQLLNMGFVPETSTPEEHGKLVRAQIEVLSGVVKIAGLRAP